MSKYSENLIKLIKQHLSNLGISVDDIRIDDYVIQTSNPKCYISINENKIIIISRSQDILELEPSYMVYWHDDTPYSPKISRSELLPHIFKIINDKKALILEMVNR